ncbi:MAG: uroporphyrinogen-III synthase [Thiomicrospira sp.]|uniref:uroporphyrinogen-III synthase n=1 Tax=Thiomicrospira sp. TaxID=935 RepID=UPI0019E6EBEA|nr:uroporphyrinogen-III synthase [Thiomicrospira sp.]MBE0494228.1 uroporphyrinogen-III synthase [Thiomicrospira sp.]
MTPTLLNTRPKHQAWCLNQALLEAGFASLDCPSLQIQTQALEHCPQWDDYDVWVFVSRNAVKHFAQQLPNKSARFNAALVAVGDATAQAIQQQGWPNLAPVPNTFDSEGMLNLAVFAQPKGLRVAIVRGDGGREYLAQSLIEQGAQVDFLEVYRRQAAPFCQTAWQTFKQAQTPVLLFTSVSSLDVFSAQLAAQNPDHQAWCFRQTLIVFSQRIQNAARKIGFSGPILVTPTSSDGAIVETLQRYARSLGESHE